MSKPYTHTDGYERRLATNSLTPDEVVAELRRRCQFALATMRDARQFALEHRCNKLADRLLPFISQLAAFEKLLAGDWRALDPAAYGIKRLDVGMQVGTRAYGG